MHTLIVDDEPLARNELAYLLGQCEEVDEIEEADSIEGALEKLLQKNVDLAFLDIHLTEESGLTLADKINQIPNPPLIVFATAYDEYAIQAFERDARDYLMKPFELDRVQETVRRAKATLSEKMQNNRKNHEDPKSPTVFPIQMDDRIFMVKPEDILALEVNQGETTIYTAEKNYKSTEPLTAWEKKLPGAHFMRVHRSYLINLNKIEEIQPWFNQTYQVTAGIDVKVPVSRSYTQEFKEKMGLANN